MSRTSEECSECLTDLKIKSVSPLRVGDGAGDIERLATSSELANMVLCSVYLI